MWFDKLTMSGVGESLGYAGGPFRGLTAFTGASTIPYIKFGTYPGSRSFL